MHPASCGHGLSELYVLYVLDGRNEVEGDCSVVDAYVLGVEVALGATVLVYLHSGLHVGVHLESAVYDECAAGLYECGVMAEAFEVGFFSAVDVEVVGVGGGDDAHPWAEPMEGAVELVGFYHYIVTFCGDDVVGAVVL